MTLQRARILKAPLVEGHLHDEVTMVMADTAPPQLARRIPALVVDARAEAEGILREAHSAAAKVKEDAARTAREEAVARVVAEHLALHIGEERRAARQLDRTIAIAALLAERLLGAALAIEPGRIAALAETALLETRGARRLRVEASPSDVAALETLLQGVAAGTLAIEANAELARGSLIVHTELGRIDARLGPQLTRLAEALREALASEIPS